jgi:hypothetical protein
MPARHERGPEACAHLPAAHARAEEAAALGILLLAPDGVGPETIAAVHHDVVGLDAGAEELLDDGIHGQSCFTRMRILRGFSSAATNSGSADVPTNPPGVSRCPATNFCMTAVVRL